MEFMLIGDAVILELIYLLIEIQREMLVLEEVLVYVDNLLQLVAYLDHQNPAVVVHPGN